MNCERFEELSTLHLSGELSAEIETEFDRHRTECQVCAALLNEQIRTDNLLRASLAERAVRVNEVQDRVLRDIHRPPWWMLYPRKRALQAACATAVLLIALIGVRGRLPRSPETILLESAAADHVEDVIQRIPKAGWVKNNTEAESLAQVVLGDGRPVRLFAPAGYSLARARVCNLEGKSQRWLHLIYEKGGREVSIFVKSSAASLATEGQMALDGKPRWKGVGQYAVAGVRQRGLGIVFVGDVSRAESIEIVRSAASSIS